MLQRSKLNFWKPDNQMAVMPPINTAPPMVVGSPILGINLSVNTGTWALPPSSFDIQWYVNGTPAVGKTGFLFGLLTVLNLGQTISAKITANNSVGSTEIFSNSVNILAA
ncbi:hypothetical protein LZG74_25480 [Dyadobacter sp. CY327]|uniref:hypothetical protein n=1 Tax=Dyadobacter sp. CY327 TaxID=2907301 RepID=UPI001F35747B|nr:hypothetical protein [Dyadobacter sp. CY327]MCE7073687.1 hypothetical protein [Dyadobacter sp. CY327]